MLGRDRPHQRRWVWLVVQSVGITQHLVPQLASLVKNQPKCCCCCCSCDEAGDATSAVVTTGCCSCCSLVGEPWADNANRPCSFTTASSKQQQQQLQLTTTTTTKTTAAARQLQHIAKSITKMAVLARS